MGKQKPRKKPPRERPYVSNLELRQVLQERLNERELNALEKQIRTACEIACDRAVTVAITETCKRDWVVVFRVLRDRFGWGRVRIQRMWGTAKEYLIDLDAGRIKTEELESIAERDDGIIFTFDGKGRVKNEIRNHYGHHALGQKHGGQDNSGLQRGKEQ